MRYRCLLALTLLVLSTQVLPAQDGAAIYKERCASCHDAPEGRVPSITAIKAMTGGGVDYSFEAVGLKHLAEQCYDALRPGGTATIIGMIPVGQKVEIDGPKLLSERKIQGTNMGSNRFRIDMPRYIDFYLQGRLNLDDMVSKRARLENVNEAFESMKKGEVARTVLMFD